MFLGVSKLFRQLYNLETRTRDFKLALHLLFLPNNWNPLFSPNSVFFAVTKNKVQYSQIPWLKHQKYGDWLFFLTYMWSLIFSDSVYPHLCEMIPHRTIFNFSNCVTEFLTSLIYLHLPWEQTTSILHSSMTSHISRVHYIVHLTCVKNLSITT